MYYLDRTQHAVVADNFSLVGGNVVWDFLFRRNLTDSEISTFTGKHGMLDKIYLSLGKPDDCFWK